jgi:exodeoxyribonuclease V
MTNTLNEGQQAAADAFLEFLFTGTKEFNIKGPGGVGKTFLMGYLINKILPRYEEQCKIMGIPVMFETVVMTATTNKAAEALSQATGNDTSTIHSFLALKTQNDYKTGEVKLKRRNDWVTHSNKIVVIDEGSMIDSQLYYEIHAALDDTCRIIYVGDHCQLPPVMEKISPIYKSKMTSCRLTENVRAAAQPDLLALCEQFRDTTQTLDFKPIQTVPGVIDHMNNDQIQAEIASMFSQQNRTDRILCYTNERVQQFNDHIRQLRGLPDRFVAGELLINNNAFVNKKFILTSEKEVEIVSANQTTRMIKLQDNSELEAYDVTIRFNTNVTAEVTIPVDREHIQELKKYYGKQKMWATYFELMEGMPDLRQRDAGTVYKAQGSTYDTVIIDLADITTSNNPRQVAHMLYVAVSRPRNRIILFGDLPAKYGSVIC